MMLERIKGIFSKKDLEQLANADAADAIEGGWSDPIKMMVHARRALAYLTAYEKGLNDFVRGSFETEIQAEGATLTHGSTGERLSYADDDIYCQLMVDLSRRKELLMAAANGSEIYDENGAEVPKVGVKTASKETLIVKL